MMTSLYDRIARTSEGAKALSSARLRHEVLGLLHRAFEVSGLNSQSDLARILRVRRSAVNQVFRGDGNLRISTLAEYLHAMGYELDLRLVEAGEPRRAAVENRSVRPAFTSTNIFIHYTADVTSPYWPQLISNTPAVLSSENWVSTEPAWLPLLTFGEVAVSNVNRIVGHAAPVLTSWPTLSIEAQPARMSETSTSIAEVVGATS